MVSASMNASKKIIYKLYNNDLPLPFSSFMPPWFEEVFRLLAVGSGSSWFGLVCPAHCTTSVPYLLALFGSGLCLGVVLTLCLGLYLYFCLSFGPSVGVPLARPPLRPTSSARLLAYLHERAQHPNHRD